MKWPVDFHPEFKREFDKFEFNEMWRVAFAFDPERRAILLTGADKKGKNQNRFYYHLVRVADQRFSEHLKQLSKIETHGNTVEKSAGRISKRQAGKNKGKGK